MLSLGSQPRGHAGVMAMLVLVCVSGGQAWETEEMDMFDLVEEVGVERNFYEFLGVEKDADNKALKKAYKVLALTLHPDKSDAPDAEVQFRQLAGMYEVLKNKTQREWYDRVLYEGLPNWRTPAFYFRKMRAIGLAEGLLYLLMIATLIQYFMNKAAHWERRLTIQENLNAEVKRRQKRLKKEGKSQEEIDAQYKEAEAELLGAPPTYQDTLPFQLYRLAKYCVLGAPALPGFFKNLYDERQKEKEEAEREEREAEEEVKRREEEKERRKENKAKRKNVNMYREVKEDKTVEVVETQEEEEAVPRNANQVWTDDDLATLAKFIKKFPGGTADRWDRIAESMERYTDEVIKMAGKIKSNPSLVPISSAGQGVTGRESTKHVSDDVLEDSEVEYSDETTEDEVDEDGYVVYSAQKVEDYIPVEEKKKKKTKGNEVEGDAWSQDQQKAFEIALKQFPKGSGERWEQVAGQVEGKDKEECQARFKHIADMIKKKKEAAQ